MGRKTQADDAAGILPGTLDMLILQTLTEAPLHGYGIASRIRERSAEVIRVEEGSLYPALRRLQVKGLVRSKWRLTPTNRRARYYELTAAGRRGLVEEVEQYERIIAGIGRVLGRAT